VSAAADNGLGVIVVGAGPTGLTLGCLLHLYGVPCRVIDRAAAPTAHSRALGMFTRSLEILDELGAAEAACERGHSIERTNIHSGGRRIATMRTEALSGTRRARILSLPQYETEALLEARFEELGGRVERETALRDLRQPRDGGPPTLWLQGAGEEEEEEVMASWVVGADGAHSAVRKALGIAFEGEATRDVFVIFDAFVENAPAAHEVQYYFSREGITVVSPLPDGAYRFAASMRGLVGDGSPLGVDFIGALLERRVGGGIELLRLRDAGWGAAQVRVHTRIAERFRRARCLLAGDAAHVYGPLGGQGMNGGIQDAHNLAWKLALVAGGEARETLLDSYEAERHAISRAALRMTAGQARLGGLRSRVATVLRDGVVAGASRAGLLEREMLPQSVMLAHRYPRGPAVLGRRRGARGRRLPDAILENGGSGSLRLFDLLRERPFTVLALATAKRDRERLDRLRWRLERAHGEQVALLEVGEDGAGAGGRPELLDRDGELRRAVGAARSSLCLARRDGFVAYCGPLASEGRLQAGLRALLTPSAESVAVD